MSLNKKNIELEILLLDIGFNRKYVSKAHEFYYRFNNCACSKVYGEYLLDDDINSSSEYKFTSRDIDETILFINNYYKYIFRQRKIKKLLNG